MSPIRNSFQRAAGATIQGFQPYTCPPSIKTVFSTPLAAASDNDQHPWRQFTDPPSQLPRLAPRPDGKGRSLPTPPGSPTRHRMRITASRDEGSRSRKTATGYSVTSVNRPSLAGVPRTFDPSASTKNAIREWKIRRAQKNKDSRAEGDIFDLLKSMSLDNKTPTNLVPAAPTPTTTLLAPIPVKAWVAPTLLAHPRNRERHHAKELYTPYNKSRVSIKERISASTESTASGPLNHVPKHRNKLPIKCILRKSSSHKDTDDAGNSPACLADGTNGGDADHGANKALDAPRAKTLQEQVFGGDSDLEDEDEAVLPAAMDKGKGKAVDPAERGKATQERGSLEEANGEDGRKEQPEKCVTPPLPARKSPATPPASCTADAPAAIPSPQPDTTQSLPSPALAPVLCPPSMIPTSSFPTSFPVAPHYVPVGIYRESKDYWDNWDYMELDGDWEMTDVSGDASRTWRWTWDFCRVQKRYIYGLFGY